MTTNKQQMVSRIEVTTPLGKLQTFFSVREETERKVRFLQECGNTVVAVAVVPREQAAGRMVSGEGGA